jgi:hypothetical protein
MEEETRIREGKEFHILDADELKSARTGDGADSMLMKQVMIGGAQLSTIGVRRGLYK